jgi:superfamily II DNA or RNA helicase
MSISLRPYQIESVNKILTELEKTDSVLLQMPTGTGKTTIFSEIIKKWSIDVYPGKRILVLVHRKELVTQIIDRFKQFGILAGRIQAGHNANLLLQIQVGLIQSLNNPQRLPDNISLIVIDEAHHTPSKSYRKLLNHYSSKSLKVLGVTATPYRLSGESFKDLFDKLITSNSISKFIEDGWLSPTKHLATSLPDFSSVRIRNKEFVEEDLDLILRSEKVMAELIESYKKYGENKKAIVFALNKSHSKDIVERFIKDGISATFIDSDTPPFERDKIVNSFKLGEFKILCNVNIFTEGFDCPDVEVVQLARPTKSFSLYLQQVGRVMRPLEGKRYGLILDNACLWKEHGLVTQYIKWSLNGIEKKEQISKIATKNNNNVIQVEGVLPTEIIGLELVEIKDESNFEPEINVNEINLPKAIENVDLKIIYPEKKEDIRVVNFAIKLKVPTSEILNCLERIYKIAGINEVVFSNSKKINYLLQAFIEAKIAMKINSKVFEIEELIFSFCSFYNILQEVAIKILNEDHSWFDLISEKIKEDEVLNDLGYYIDDKFFKKLNIALSENEYLYNNAVTILLFIDAISIERVLFNHYNNERNNIVSDYQFLKKYNSNGLFNFQGQTTYWSKESGSYNLLKKYDVNKLINFVNNYFKKMLTSISTKLSIDEFDFEYIIFENLVKSDYTKT